MNSTNPQHQFFPLESPFLFSAIFFSKFVSINLIIPKNGKILKHKDLLLTVLEALQDQGAVSVKGHIPAASLGGKRKNKRALAVELTASSVVIIGINSCVRVEPSKAKHLH